jgi:hypothetical protein
MEWNGSGGVCLICLVFFREGEGGERSRFRRQTRNCMDKYGLFIILGENFPDQIAKNSGKLTHAHLDL